VRPFVAPSSVQHGLLAIGLASSVEECPLGLHFVNAIGIIMSGMRKVTRIVIHLDAAAIIPTFMVAHGLHIARILARVLDIVIRHGSVHSDAVHLDSTMNEVLALARIGDGADLVVCTKSHAIPVPLVGPAMRIASVLQSTVVRHGRRVCVSVVQQPPREEELVSRC